MGRFATVLGTVVMLWAVGVCGAEEGNAPAGPSEGAEETPPSVLERDSLTGNLFGYGDRLSEKGLTLGLSVTQVYQGMAHGGVFTHRHAGRYTGSYDLEAEGDLEALAGLKGASFYIAAEGSWSEGLDASSLGSLFGVNDDAGGNRSIDVTEFWYQQNFLDGRVMVRLGKLDLTGGFECRGCPVSFDGNAYANDETTQFLNGALVNNPTIPFPEEGLGAVVHVEVLEGWYVSAGIGDAQADARETGFNTAFHDEDYFLSVYETGLVTDLPSANGPMRGAYRVGFWHDPQPKDRFDGTGAKRDDLGLYVSLDQVLLRESKDAEDGQGLGVFLRCGWADREVNPVRAFWSAGAQYQGLVPGRDADVLGIGMARGRLTDEPGAGFTARHETVLEATYAIQVAPWLQVSPHVQYIADPGGLGEVRDAVILGVRIQAAL